MKKELIKTQDYLLVVDDSEIKTWYYDEYSKKVHHSGGAEYSRNDITKNIVAHLPLNGYGILEGVPLLPPLEQEDDVEKLAEGEYPIIPNTSPNVNWDRANKQEGFERGYNKAKEKYKFTEEDMINFACKVYNENYDTDDSFFTTAETLIKSFSQPKTPTHFEFEIERKSVLNLGIKPFNPNTHVYTNELKTTTNSQGQQLACGKYIY